MKNYQAEMYTFSQGIETSRKMSSYLSDETMLDNLQNHVYGSQQRAETVKKSNKLKLREW